MLKDFQNKQRIVSFFDVLRETIFEKFNKSKEIKKKNIILL